jgi:hypothetical protein
MDGLDMPTLAAIAACCIAIIVAGAGSGLAAKWRERRERRTQARPMRTANSSLINRQVRELQRRASETQR